jgi:PAS domain S-box-containing protein
MEAGMPGEDAADLRRTNEQLAAEIERRIRIEAELRRRTEELRHVNKFLTAVVDNIPDMIFVKEAANLRFVRFNKAGEELLGYSKDELMGKNDFDFFPPSQAEFFIVKDRAVLTNGKLLDIAEEPIHTRLHGDRILHTKKIPIYDERGRPEYLLGISEDITEKKRAGELREKLAYEAFARQEAEKTVGLRDDFIAVAAHELRTPLTSLRLQVAMLPQAVSQGGAVPVHKLAGQVDRLSRLVNLLLDVSRIRSGRLVLELADTDLCEVIKKVAGRFGSDTGYAQANLQLQLEACPQGSWDPERLEQVAENLISNAIKFGAGRPVVVTARPVAGGAQFAVRDYGPGIGPEDQARIFRRYERAAAARPVAGLGLGLWIAAEIVAAHGGSIRVESEPGAGARFVVELPARPVKAQGQS